MESEGSREPTKVIIGYGTEKYICHICSYLEAKGLDVIAIALGSEHLGPD